MGLVQKGALLDALLKNEALQFDDDGGKLDTPSPEVATAIADALKCLLRDDETIKTGLQVRLSQAPQSERWIGNVTWYLIVPKRALLEIEVAATLVEGPRVMTASRSRRWPLRSLGWTQIEETRPRPSHANDDDVSCKVTAAFGDDLLTIESAALQEEATASDERRATAATQARDAARQFLVELLLQAEEMER